MASKMQIFFKEKGKLQRHKVPAVFHFMIKDWMIIKELIQEDEFIAMDKIIKIHTSYLN